MKASRQAKSGSPEQLNHSRFVSAFAQAAGISYEQSEMLFDEPLLQVVKACKEYFKPIDQGVEFVRRIAPNCKVVLATNPVLPKECTHLRVSWTGLNANDFTYITHSQNSRACKPSPLYYESIIKELEKEGITKEDCLFIGNDPEDDGPAASYGITTILLNRDRTEFKTLQQASGDAAALYEGSWSLIARQFGTMR